MLFEILGFASLVCLSMFVLAEWKKEAAAVGIIGGIMLTLVGVWLAAEPIQVKTGESSTITQTINNSVINISNSSSAINTTYTYTNATASFFNLNQTLGVIFMLIGIYGGLRYSFLMRNAWG